MQYRNLGNTGLRVSILGYGAANLGGIYGPVDEAEAVRSVHLALDRGINLFDCSPYYGSTRAESVLGRALQDVPRDRYLMATKCGRYDVDAFDFSPGRIRRSLDESLQRLRTDHVDVFQLHDVEFGDLDRILDESVATLHELKRSGKVRFVGITGLPLAIFRRAVAAGARLDVVLSYCHNTLFDDTLLGLATDLAREGIGVLCASPTGMGLLSPHGPPPWHPAPPVVREHCLRAVQHCLAHGVNPATLSMQVATRDPRIASTFCGTASTMELDANLRAIEQPPEPTLLHEVQQILAPIRNLTWVQGRPENQR